MRFVVSMLVSVLFYNLSLYGKEFNTKSIVGKWKITGDYQQLLNVQKGQVMFSIENDSLLLSVNTKGKWLVVGPKFYIVPVSSNENEVRFESTKIIDYDTTEVREYDTYHYTYFLRLTFLKKNMFSMELGSSQLPVQVNEHVPYTRPIVSTKFSVISK
jgi:hypothetical protein